MITHNTYASDNQRKTGLNVLQIHCLFSSRDLENAFCYYVIKLSVSMIVENIRLPYYSAFLIWRRKKNINSKSDLYSNYDLTIMFSVAFWRFSERNMLIYREMLQ